MIRRKLILNVSFLFSVVVVFRTWQAECKRKTKPSLVRAVAKTFWTEFFLMGVLCFYNDVVVRLLLPFLLEQLLTYFRYVLLFFIKNINRPHNFRHICVWNCSKGSEMSQSDALWYGSAIVGLSISSGIGLLHYFYFGYYYGMRVRVAVCNLIYRKVMATFTFYHKIIWKMIKMVTSIYVIRIHSFQSLQLSQRALTDTAPGKLVNLLSNDVNRFDIISVLVNPLWCSPVMTIIAAYILWVEVRWAGMIGMAIVFLIVPIQSNYRCGWMPKCCCPETHK